MSTTLSWNCTFGASTYRLQVSTQGGSNFANGIIRDISNITATSSPVTGLSYGTTYYWRVNATNLNGTGAWSSIRSWTTQSSQGGGCPYVFGWNGEEFIADNNILPQSEYRGNEHKSVTDYYKLMATPKIEEGHYILKIKEFEEELSQLDQIELIAVDHSQTSDVAVLPTSEIIQYTMPFTITGDLSQENASAKRLSEIDGATISAVPGQSLSLSFQPVYEEYARLPEHTEGGMLLGGWVTGGVKGYGLPKAQSVGAIADRERFDGSTSFTFRERLTLVYVPLQTIDQTPVLKFDNRVALDYANLVVRIPSAYTSRSLRLITARHTHNGEVVSKLKSADGYFTSLRPGESIELSYEAPPLDADKIRSFILVSHGRYEHLKASAMTGTPQTFQLDQNYPNPFNPQTTVSYQLAASGHVTVAVYDILGQEVITLAEENQEAGYYEKTWDAASSSSGIYYVRMSVTDQLGKQLYQATRKIVLMK
ncbi:MAG: T9SS type A sorting domain-containing protein [Ignavibacteria bacterium]|nr:T9SS type A sorting domain-containing protein [Ignavibacteria bacterium]MBI3766253.1 T9SS type A sorting domain-containing protein [Ignavibacteriales bacterium]